MSDSTIRYADPHAPFVPGAIYYNPNVIERKIFEIEIGDLSNEEIVALVSPFSHAPFVNDMFVSDEEV